MRIGVLALQGDFSRHAVALRAAGAEVEEVRRESQLDELDGIVLPGGESTSLLKLMEGTEFFERLRRFHDEGGAIYGTCAGLILLARSVENPPQLSLGLIDATVRRNGYGRQVDSFEAEAAIPALGDQPFRLVFIRAPVIQSVGAGVEVLAEQRGRPVMIRRGRVLATTFHPELTGDVRVHRLFTTMCRGNTRDLGQRLKTEH